MEKKRLRTITLLFSKKNCNSQITNNNEINEKKGKRTKKRKKNENKKKCNRNILSMSKKVDSFNTKNHVIVMF